VTGGWAIEQERCRELLDRGRSLGIVPSADAVQRLLQEWNAAKCFRIGRTDILPAMGQEWKDGQGNARGQPSPANGLADLFGGTDR
jgi:hypothetical protein